MTYAYTTSGMRRNYTGGFTYEGAAEYLSKGRDKRRRKIANNTYLEQLDNGNYGVRLHYTIVVEILPGDRYRLYSGGWHTPTTKDRITSESPARLGSDTGQWYIWHDSDPVSPPKIQKCRTCKGTGKRLGPSYREGAPDKCYRCDGSGKQDYGSKQIPTPFYEGIVVDSTGKVTEEVRV